VVYTLFGLKNNMPELQELTVEEKVQKDLDDGKYGMICSNEQTFKKYVFRLLEWQKSEFMKCLPDRAITIDDNKLSVAEFMRLHGYNYCLDDIMKNLKKAKLI
jgi:hypothetical protein